MQDTYVIAFRPPDAQWKAMKEVWDICTKNNVDVPSEVWAFFDDEPPEPGGVKLEIPEATEEWDNGEDQEGFQVDLEKLPPGIRFIRFYHSY